MRRSEQIIFQNTYNRAQSILPPDLLPVFVCSTEVRDRHFINSPLTFGNFRCNFRLETKSIFLNFNGICDLTTKRLVTDFHIRQVDVGHHVAEQGQEVVPDLMPEIQHAMGPRTRESTAIHNICYILLNQRDQRWNISWIVLEIRILNNDDISCRDLDRSPNGCAFTLIFFVFRYGYIRMYGADFTSDIETRIRRAIINNDKLDFVNSVLDIEDSIDNGLEGVFLVEDGDENRELHDVLLVGRLTQLRSGVLMSPRRALVGPASRRPSPDHLE